MPDLKNAKHEHFAQLVSNGESLTRTYVLAGYSENGAVQSAHRLLTNAQVCSRVELVRKAAVRSVVRSGQAVTERRSLRPTPSGSPRFAASTAATSSGFVLCAGHASRRRVSLLPGVGIASLVRATMSSAPVKR